MELFSEGYVTSPPPHPPPPLPLRQVKGFLSRVLSRECREDPQPASQPSSGAKDGPPQQRAAEQVV